MTVAGNGICIFVTVSNSLRKLRLILLHMYASMQGNIHCTLRLVLGKTIRDD